MEAIRERVPDLFVLVAIALVVAVAMWFLAEPSQGALAACGWHCKN